MSSIIMNKKWRKVYMNLDYKEYHLCRNIDIINGETWMLFKKYEGWTQDNSGPIMTSEDYTLDDLVKFAKKHRDVNMFNEFNKWVMLVCIINMILIILNLTVFRNEKLGSYLLGGIIYVAVLDIFMHVSNCIKWCIEDANMKLNFSATLSKYNKENSNGGDKKVKRKNR